MKKKLHGFSLGALIRNKTIPTVCRTRSLEKRLDYSGLEPANSSPLFHEKN